MIFCFILLDICSSVFEVAKFLIAKVLCCNSVGKHVQFTARTCNGASVYEAANIYQRKDLSQTPPRTLSVAVF
ncbi:hypothetical protein M758_1G130100 [Ceratodon purpureus]|uniref:Secreted protein n=1 Tax=Ceratodon purpureus TaxID=3225 RepID=A0A8T0J5W1_CERPU|nr:hypothetical protein KC19_1G135300 [Ceratodon purpureus]KAG0629785.1 hypothetical protein M758_1G130100 [Ceratodon purpureus]